MNESTDNPMVFLITGAIKRSDWQIMQRFNALLSAPDEDTAVRNCLDALAREGFSQAELDQIGDVLPGSQDEDLSEAYRRALDGEIYLMILDDQDH